jgi:predicted transglutaminase-like cysteine proteinase
LDNAVDQISDDNLVYGKHAYWATEVVFVNFLGHCRDFALEKYRVLRRAGVPDADMEIVVGYPKAGRHAGELHAVLRVDDGVHQACWIADSRMCSRWRHSTD